MRLENDQRRTLIRMGPSVGRAVIGDADVNAGAVLPPCDGKLTAAETLSSACPLVPSILWTDMTTAPTNMFSALWPTKPATTPSEPVSGSCNAASFVDRPFDRQRFHPRQKRGRRVIEPA
jgi:hypothetical protein